MGRKLMSVREDTLRCSCCTRWLPDDAFSTTNAAAYARRRGRGGYCHECAALYQRYYNTRRKQQAS